MTIVADGSRVTIRASIGDLRKVRAAWPLFQSAVRALPPLQSVRIVTRVPLLPRLELSPRPGLIARVLLARR